jgi:hypothetical protein
MATGAQPDDLQHIRFRFEEVTASELGGVVRAPTIVISAGNSVKFLMEFGFDGPDVGLLNGDRFSIFHHIERIEDGFRINLSGGGFTVPAPGLASRIPVESGPFTTGDTGSGANFEIPGGFDAGTFRVVTHVHADNAAQQFIAGFHDGLIVLVTKP